MRERERGGACAARPSHCKGSALPPQGRPTHPATPTIALGVHLVPYPTLYPPPHHPLQVYYRRKTGPRIPPPPGSYKTTQSRDGSTPKPGGGRGRKRKDSGISAAAGVGLGGGEGGAGAEYEGLTPGAPTALTAAATRECGWVGYEGLTPRAPTALTAAATRKCGWGGWVGTGCWRLVCVGGGVAGVSVGGLVAWLLLSLLPQSKANRRKKIKNERANKQAGKQGLSLCPRCSAGRGRGGAGGGAWRGGGDLQV